MRYGRIKASKAHKVSVCHTPDGSLVATIIGAKIPDTTAMKRGRKYVCQENPMIAALPDGLMKDAVIEIKCPTKAKTKDSYLKNCRNVRHMYATGVKKCYFCVADSNFEETKNVDIILVT
ncbi:Alkaline nuclease, partial [Operophtera brumata]